MRLIRFLDKLRMRLVEFFHTSLINQTACTTVQIDYNVHVWPLSRSIIREIVRDRSLMMSMKICDFWIPSLLVTAPLGADVICEWPLTEFIFFVSTF